MNLPQRQVHSCHSRGLGWEFLQGYLCLHCWVELSLAALWEKYFISSTPRCISAATLTDLASQRYTEGQQCQQESLAQCLQLSFLFVLFVLYSFFSGVSAWQSSASETDHHLDNHRRHGHRCDTCKGLSQGGSCSQWWAGQCEETCGQGQQGRHYAWNKTLIWVGSRYMRKGSLSGCTEIAGVVYAMSAMLRLGYGEFWWIHVGQGAPRRLQKRLRPWVDLLILESMPW